MEIGFIRIETLQDQADAREIQVRTYFWGFLSNDALHAAEQK
jgi:hypothetical protein